MALSGDPVLKFDLAYLNSLDIPHVRPEEAPPHVRIFGSPRIGLLHVAGPSDGAGFVAIWTADRDGFDYTEIPEAEAAFVLDGVLRLTPSGGDSLDILAGQGYRLPAGWSGRVEAVEPVRKVYFLLD
ncbi:MULTISPECIES: cupin domain-containing protein [unclassified Mycolicibacterium]|uniref:cupin domain-containing protein n=1 Tax=unclassified Mycolicibacterium TaxID=2636767 RepID=UPI002ED9D2F4